MSRANDLAGLLTTVGSGGGSGTQPYSTIADLPLTGNETGEQAFVSENNRLYIWNGTGWYNIALINTTPTAITGASGSYTFATDGTPIVLTLVSTDPEGIPITWSHAVTSGSLTNGGGTTATISQNSNVFTITPTTTEDYAGEFGLTFTASDGVNLATATSSFTLQFAILNSKYTTLMLKTSGTNAQQNNTFVDSSSNNFTITRNGNPTQGTFSPYGDKWSNYFDGTGDYLSPPSNAAFAFGTGAYTVEAWVYRTATDSDTSILFSAASATGAFNFGINPNGALILSNYGTGPVVTGNAGDVPLDSWCHIVAVRSSTSANDTKLYANGVLKVTGTDANNWTVSSSPIIGGFTTASNYDFIGYISNFRIVKGTAVYTSNFTPPTEPLTAIANTSLLTCQSNSFKDNSTNNFAITKSGDVKVQRFSPFDLNAPYDPAVISGSAYFKQFGVYDYLTIPGNTAFAFGTGNFTIDLWCNLSVLGVNQTLFRISDGILLRISNTNKVIVRADGSADLITSSASMSSNTWTHLAFSRSGTTLSLWINGSRADGGTATDSRSYLGNQVYIGADAPATFSTTGYISDIRVVKGTAIYDPSLTAITVPTAPLTAITNTSLLLKNTNAGIYDNSGNNDIETVGNAQVSTAITKYGSSSMYFDGTGDYLSIKSTPPLYLSTGDFTIECWFYALDNGLGFPAGPILTRRTAYDSTGLQISISNNAQRRITFACGDTSLTWEVQFNNTTDLSLNTWYHIAVVRSGNTFTLYLNGIAENSATSSVVIAHDTAAMVIGSTESLNDFFKGYISDLRITKGLARYTANFTPPTSELLG